MMQRTTKDLSSTKFIVTEVRGKLTKERKVRQIGRKSWRSGNTSFLEFRFQELGKLVQTYRKLEIITQLTPPYLPPRFCNRHLSIFALLPMYPSDHFKNVVILFAKGFAGAQMVENLPAMRETRVLSLDWEDPVEEGIAPCSSILAWRIPKDRSLAGYRPRGPRESDTTEQLSTHKGFNLFPFFPPLQPLLFSFSQRPQLHVSLLHFTDKPRFIILTLQKSLYTLCLSVFKEMSQMVTLGEITFPPFQLG